MRMHRTALAPATALVFAICASAQAQVTSEQRSVDQNGDQTVVRTSQPPATNYGPRPSFEQLDRNHDGFVTRDEAEAFTPLLNDFDNVTHGDRISRGQYARWDYR